MHTQAAWINYTIYLHKNAEGEECEKHSERLINLKSKGSAKMSEITLEERSIASITVSFCTKKPMGYFGFEQKRTK